MCSKQRRKIDRSQSGLESPGKSFQNMRTEADVADFCATDTEGDMN